MKKIIFAAILIFIGGGVFSQTLPNSFKLINNQHPEQEAFYIASISKAKMEPYRLKNQRVKLIFNNGFELEMLSAKELYLSDNSVLVGSYPESFPINYQLPAFNVLPDGHLIAVYPDILKSKSTK